MRFSRSLIKPIKVVIVIAFQLVMLLLTSCASTGYSQQDAGKSKSAYLHTSSIGSQDSESGSFEQPLDQDDTEESSDAVDSDPHDPELAKALIDAVKEGNLELVRSLLEQGADPELVPDGYFFPAIIEAVTNGHHDIAVELLAFGANPDVQGINNRTPLYYAAYNEYPDLVDLLLRYGADPNLGESSVHHCIETENTLCTLVINDNHPENYERKSDSLTGSHYVEILASLLDAGAHVDYQWYESGDLYHPVISTARFNNVEMMDVLIDHGINTDDPWRDQCLQFALDLSLPGIAERMLELGADPNARHEYSWPETMLAKAIFSGYWNAMYPDANNFGGEYHDEIVQMLLDAGADPNVRDSSTDTPLMLASRIGTPGIIAALIDTGADPNAQDHYGFTALMMAAGFGRPEIARALVDSGADVSTQGSTGYTALICASMRYRDFVGKLTRETREINSRPDIQSHGADDKGGQLEVINILLNSGCDTDAVGHQYDEISMRDGPTALWYAVDLENVELVRLLLDHGADPNAGENLYMNAYYKDNEEVKNLLIDAGMQVDDEWCSIILHSELGVELDVIQDLVEMGVDPNIQIQSNGFTYLMRCSSRGNYNIVNFLLDAGADPNRAIQHSVLLGDGTEEWKTGQYTAILYAAQRNHPGIVRLLMDAGADIEMANADGITPLLFAAGVGVPLMVEILLDGGADVNVACDGGYTPIMCAAMPYEEFYSIVQNQDRDTRAEVPVHPARDPARVIDLLLDAGCDPNAIADDGKTAHDIAIEYGNEEIASLL